MGPARRVFLRSGEGRKARQLQGVRQHLDGGAGRDLPQVLSVPGRADQAAAEHREQPCLVRQRPRRLTVVEGSSRQMLRKEREPVIAARGAAPCIQHHRRARAGGVLRHRQAIHPHQVVPPGGESLPHHLAHRRRAARSHLEGLLTDRVAEAVAPYLRTGQRNQRDLPAARSQVRQQRRLHPPRRARSRPRMEGDEVDFVGLRQVFQEPKCPYLRTPYHRQRRAQKQNSHQSTGPARVIGANRTSSGRRAGKAGFDPGSARAPLPRLLTSIVGPHALRPTQGSLCYRPTKRRRQAALPRPECGAL